MLFASVVTPVGLAVGLPVLMRNVRPGEVAEVAQLFHGMLAVAARRSPRS